nr:adherens junction-associated protein 1-like [Microcebus murinus]
MTISSKGFLITGSTDTGTGPEPWTFLVALTVKSARGRPYCLCPREDGTGENSLGARSAHHPAGYCRERETRAPATWSQGCCGWALASTATLGGAPPCLHPALWRAGSHARPPPSLLPGLAVHQVITITVSLIMVIAALITTLVLKNCCAQSGNTRRNSHQRKTNQQEESCQNLTDFTSARVASSLDIFTAYNETLQCSHECVRASVPVYTEETLHPAGEYKSTFNGNRPSSSDRHLIPVAFVSEKWFEISC